MRKVTVFNFVTLNGYFEGPQKGDISWHKHGAEESEYAVEMLKTRGHASLWTRDLRVHGTLLADTGRDQK